MKKRIQLIIDITMAVLLPLLMAYSLIGEAFHEVVGTAMFVLFIVRRVKRGAQMSAIRADVRRLEKLVEQVQADIADYSREQMQKLNHRFSERYGDEIDTYEEENVIVTDVLSIKWSV